MANYPGDNPAIKRNSLIFAILTFITHILACFMFGFFFKIPAHNFVNNTIGAEDFAPIFSAFAHGILVLGGIIFFNFRIWFVVFVLAEDDMVWNGICPPHLRPVL